MEKLKDQTEGVVKLACETLRTMLKTATGSVTSIPKPLKFLRPHYATLKVVKHSQRDAPIPNFPSQENYQKHSSANKKLFADILSLLAMSYSKEGERDCLAFKLEGDDDISQWGHEYIRYLPLFSSHPPNIETGKNAP